MEKEMPYSVRVAKCVLAFMYASMALISIAPLVVIYIYLTSETAKPQILFGILLPFVAIPGALYSVNMIRKGIEHDEKIDKGSPA